MKTISCFSDLRPYGIDALTGEACGLSYRILFDLTASGQKIVEKCLGCKITAEAWNRGTAEEPHTASIMLSAEMLVPLGIFALLESGCTEVWFHADRTLLGFEASDPPRHRATYRKIWGDQLTRTFAYRGTAGHRNEHMMSGRIE